MPRCRAVWWGETTQQCHVPGAQGHIAQHSTNRAGEGLWSLRTLLSCCTLLFQILVTMSCSRCSCRSTLLSHRELGLYHLMTENNCATFVKCQHWKGVLIPTVTGYHLQQSCPQTMHIFGLLRSLQFTMVSYGLGQTQFHRKQTLEEILRPCCRSLVPLARSHPIMHIPHPCYHETTLLHPAWVLMEVYLTTERGICRRPVGKDSCSQRQWECTWHLGTWDNSELDPGTTLGFSPMHIHYTWKKVNRTSPMPGDQATSLQKWLPWKEISELQTKSI